MPHARTPSPEVREKFGRRLASWRRRHNPVITQAQAADLLSEVGEPVAERTWSRWEQGVTAPTGKNPEAVIELTGIEISDLFGPRHEGTVSRKWLEEQFQELHAGLTS